MSDRDLADTVRAADVLRTKIAATRRRYVPSTPEKYPHTYVDEFPVLDAEVMLAALDALVARLDETKNSKEALMAECGMLSVANDRLRARLDETERALREIEMKPYRAEEVARRALGGNTTEPTNPQPKEGDLPCTE